ncbi:unnamed protein product [Ilex paraguariensis]|uniref:Uncharacterized protein n=1 Tax=Ilex paraguariensis TaxID=185542 RepID=A0ABC8UT28_9AQUA
MYSTCPPLKDLSMLLLGCFTVLGDEVYSVSWTQSPHLPPIYSPVEAPKPGKHHHPGHHRTRNQPPSHPPLQPPSHTPLQPPRKPPLQPPTQPPSYPVSTRELVAVQGVVYCKSCKYTGIDTLWKASPLAG